MSDPQTRTLADELREAAHGEPGNIYADALLRAAAALDELAKDRDALDRLAKFLRQFCTDDEADWKDGFRVIVGVVEETKRDASSYLAWDDDEADAQAAEDAAVTHAENQVEYPKR